MRLTSKTRFRSVTTVLILMAALATAMAQTKGKVYLVLGSDTAIWEGMNVDEYNDTYTLSLYTSPSRNAYAVMDPSWRTRLVDSYGTPMKLTWWMMAGNIFRYATNTDVPLPNTMTLYLMQQYHGDAIQQFGDELTLHYHTFVWTDYDGDGLYWWNQAANFTESRDDFDVTLAQFLLEHQVFPVSFRSGWHAMDNDWQQYLDQILPYSLHNDWPAKRSDPTEPIDNVFDWSQSPSAWVPFHPSPSNYQIPGPGKGWNVRSKHIGSVDSTLINTLFAQANQGIDQVACLWGHLPEEDFLTNLEKIDGLAHRISAYYPGVMFEYATAVEAMQKWQKASDTTAPVVTFQEHQAGDDLTFTITTSEPIFQDEPFVAFKDIYERYTVIPCTQTGPAEWTTATPVSKTSAAKIGVALCDTVGNQTIEILRYRPDDLYLDNLDPRYAELRGSWTTSASTSWGTDSRVASVAPGDSATVRWTPDLGTTGLWNIQVQVPNHGTTVDSVSFSVWQSGVIVDQFFVAAPLVPNRWIYVGTLQLTGTPIDAIEMTAYGTGTTSRNASADVLKLSPLVRERELRVDPAILSLGSVSIEDTVRSTLQLTNSGIQDLTVSALSAPAFGGATASFPIVIPAMSSTVIPLWFYFSTPGTIVDTITITSDDPIHPELRVSVSADVQNYFVVLDNEDSLSYEETGSWHTSNAQAYGPSSRYAWLSEGAANQARFFTTLSKAGLYDVSEIVPSTVNAADKALYVIKVGNVAVDSVILDQNAGSGQWSLIGQYNFPSTSQVEVVVINPGLSTAPGAVVLRADAIKLALVSGPTSTQELQTGKVPTSFGLAQNYPNPFNPRTTIAYDLPQPAFVRLVVYDNLGRELRILSEGPQMAGRYTVMFDGTGLGSGIYFYRLQTGETVLTRKMILLK
jgi:hypothetical protein